MLKKISKVLVFMLAILMLFSMAACKNGGTNQASQQNQQNQATEQPKDNAKTSYPYSYTDARGEKITFDKEPAKIVSMAPNITEIVFALGKGASLVGRTDYCNYPAEASKVASVGDIFTPNVEKIASLNPDLVLISGTTMPDSLGSLKDMGIKFVVVNEQKDFDGVYQTIESIGKILNSSDKAKEITDGMKAKVADVTNKVKDLPTPKTYYIVGYGEYGEYTATGDTFLGQMITMAGGDNIAKKATGWKFNLEDIVAANPEVLICSSQSGMIKDANAALAQANGYKGLAVVKDKKAQLINEDTVSRQGPRLAEGLELLAKIIHPEAFK